MIYFNLEVNFKNLQSKLKLRVSHSPFHFLNFYFLLILHLIHFKEYCKAEKIDVFEFGTEENNQFSSYSYMIVTDDLVNKLRGSLKPHQGFKI